MHPGGTEVCNGLDDDCDGSVDNGASDATLWYEDLDGGGYGSDVSESACSAPLGYVSVTGDCDDATGSLNPGEIEN